MNKIESGVSTTVKIAAIVVVIAVVLGGVYAYGALQPPAHVTITIYGSVTASDLQPTINEFQGNYSYVTVNYVQLNPPPLYSRVTSEVAAHQSTADLIFVTNVVIYQLQNLSLLQSYNSSQVSGYPSSYYDPGGHWADALLLPTVFSYNTQALTKSQLPTTLSALTNSSWKGKIIIHDITLGSTGTQYFVSLAAPLGNQTWTNFVKQLVTNVNPTPTSQVSAVSSDVASGQFQIGIVAYLPDIVKLQGQGAPIDYFLPQGVPVMIAPESVAIIKGTTHLSAAEQFENFILSKTGQTTLGNTQTRPPAMPGITAKYTMEKLLPQALINSSIIFPTPQVAASASTWAQTFKSMGYS
jgi:ABC-type Fe3+ transport system substrate-binding protein